MVHVCCRRSLINVACAPSLSRHPGTSNRTCMFTMGPGPSSATSATEDSASTPTSRITCSCTQVRTANTATFCPLPYFDDCGTSVRSGGLSYVYDFEKPLYVIRNSLLIGQLTEDVFTYRGRSQWPHGLRHRSAAARLLWSWVRIPPGAWMFVCCECCVLSGRGLCDELITRPEESYRMFMSLCVI